VRRDLAQRERPFVKERVENRVFYARFMDDWVVLAPTRWKLRAAIREVNEVMARCKVKQHPAKTYIGRVGNGFDFLGYAFSPEGLGVAARSVGHLAAHVTRLYEQGADSCRIGDYVQRWWEWLEAGLVAERQEATSSSPGTVRPLPAGTAGPLHPTP
jgi:hypothetical protein